MCRKYDPAVIFVIACLVASSVFAQQPEFPTPQPEHGWLKQFTGHWTTSSKTVAAPEMPAMECSGSMESREIGGFWVANELEGDIDEINFTSVQILGYDPAKKKYIGTWTDSMTDHLWIYEGTVDASGKKLSLIAEGPDMMQSGKLAKYRDSYEFKSPDVIVATSEVMNDKGEWITFMSGEMKRK
ncbi:DUF1579 domain-containing protein [Bythopirellula polymerisocia]|uniref:DUF1579 domain-containing protein n=1 Tax=Bythopirellula polymerisocia TaxID=2528003 RepID=A0A5C6D095_9BACT|nr:DUF1579 domain-containing protein [Bythopirellula polymerisocia]TWU30128.1 hypothetical protein Pla144_09140 [Bythopirellula polymerisocia]